jgi:hypothetical protein
MANIDPLAAMLGPVLTGWILQVLGGGGDGEDLRAYSVQRGFAAIAVINAISFIPEMILLRTGCLRLLSLASEKTRRRSLKQN